MAAKRSATKRLHRKAKRGFRGFPIATIAFYGPDAKRASKVAVGIIGDESNEAVDPVGNPARSAPIGRIGIDSLASGSNDGQSGFRLQVPISDCGLWFSDLKPEA